MALAVPMILRAASFLCGSAATWSSRRAAAFGDIECLKRVPAAERTPARAKHVCQWHESAPGPFRPFTGAPPGHSIGCFTSEAGPPGWRRGTTNIGSPPVTVFPTAIARLSPSRIETNSLAYVAMPKHRASPSVSGPLCLRRRAVRHLVVPGLQGIEFGGKAHLHGARSKIDGSQRCDVSGGKLVACHERNRL